MNKGFIFLVTLLLALSARTAYSEVVFSEDFEFGLGDWTVEQGVWEAGTPTAGPSECHSGSDCAGTVLDGNYPGNTDSRLISPPIQLPSIIGAEKLSLSFWQWFSYGACDVAYVQVSVWDSEGSTWSDWSNLNGSMVNNSLWSRRLDELSPFADKIVRIAFYHTATTSPGCSSSATGWYIDDIEIIKDTPIFTGDFETGWGHWSADRGVWQVGAPTAGPSECHSGFDCAGTVLDGNYPGNTDSRLISSPTLLPAITGEEKLYLSFWQWFTYGACDSGFVQISAWDPVSSTWSDWSNLNGSMVNNSLWSRRLDELSPFADKIVRIAFYHTATTSPGCSSSATGWYIDDIEIIKDTPSFTGDFETGWGHWSADRGVWQIGMPSLVGPSECHAGSGCAGTVLDGNYPGNTDSRLISPPIQLQNHFDIFRQEPSLRFWQWFSYGACDQGVVQISIWNSETKAWSDWENVGNTITGSSPQWTPGRRELFTHTGNIVRIAFFHIATTSPGCSSSGNGWYIDNVRLPGVFLEPCEFDFSNDGDVDGSDLSRFSSEFGASDCSLGNFCYADFDHDGDVDGSDLILLNEDFGESACFIPASPPL